MACRSWTWLGTSAGEKVKKVCPTVIAAIRFSLKFAGLTLDGLVRFHSGCVMRIEKFEMNPANYVDLSDDTKAFIQTSMSFLNFNMTFELDCDLEEYKQPSSMVIWIQGLDFQVSVTREHATGVVVPSITFLNIAGGINKMHVYNFPDNGYMQLMAKEVK
jgi:hypothetical protein